MTRFEIFAESKLQVNKDARKILLVRSIHLYFRISEDVLPIAKQLAFYCYAWPFRCRIERSVIDNTRRVKFRTGNKMARAGADRCINSARLCRIITALKQYPRNGKVFLRQIRNENKLSRSADAQ